MMDWQRSKGFFGRAEEISGKRYRDLLPDLMQRHLVAAPGSCSVIAHDPVVDDREDAPRPAWLPTQTELE
jgi:hypothetical protein